MPYDRPAMDDAGHGYVACVRSAYSRSRRSAVFRRRRAISVNGETVVAAIACVAAAIILYAVALLLVGPPDDDDPLGLLEARPAFTAAAPSMRLPR